MAENSKIEWTDHTFNPWQGCTKVGPGCDNCYAERRQDKRLHVVQWGAGQPRKRTKTWGDPVKWNKAHQAFYAAHGRRQRVFCASLADVFDNEVPAEWRQELMSLIVRTPNLDWLLLTKRIGNAKRMLSDASMHDGLLLTANDEYRPPANLWLGATIVNQEEADRDIPKLLALPVAKRFLSMEPLLGDVRLGSWLQRSPSAAVEAGRVAADMPAWTRIGSTSIDWVIVGGERGPHARPMHPDWARSLRDQCAAAGVPFLFKQWGEWLPWTQFSDSAVDDEPEQTRFATMEYEEGVWRDVGKPDYWATMDGDIDDEQCVGRVGKKSAGRKLDGVTHDGYPAASTIGGVDSSRGGQS